MKRYLIPFLLSAMALPAVAQDFPDIYIRGDLNGWAVGQEYKLDRTENTYSIHLDKLDGAFKFADELWDRADLGGGAVISQSSTVPILWGGANFTAENLSDVTLSFNFEPRYYPFMA
ncbi:MAG: hypothetical protein K2O49_06340, partial [Muribaculaceae bacterium]|nr:hypothetical protein [Muribaculaceae bacterium]